LFSKYIAFLLLEKIVNLIYSKKYSEILIGPLLELMQHRFAGKTFGG